jgi:hypothetical protein
MCIHFLRSYAISFSQSPVEMAMVRTVAFVKVSTKLTDIIVYPSSFEYLHSRLAVTENTRKLLFKRGVSNRQLE